MSAKSLISFLVSKEWGIHRSIFDKRSNAESKFTGTGYFLPVNGFWKYLEVGELQYGESVLSVSRKYLYEAKDNEIVVRFEDRRLFYSFDCHQLPEVSFEHFCSPDQYSGKFVKHDDKWEIDWVIRGPSKDFVINSKFT